MKNKQFKKDYNLILLYIFLKDVLWKFHNTPHITTLRKFVLLPWKVQRYILYIDKSHKTRVEIQVKAKQHHHVFLHHRLAPMREFHHARKLGQDEEKSHQIREFIRTKCMSKIYKDIFLEWLSKWISYIISISSLSRTIPWAWVLA